MQNETIISSTSVQKLEESKERLRNALVRLEKLIQKQNETLGKEQKVRTKVVSDLDAHINNLETFLKKQS